MTSSVASFEEYVPRTDSIFTSASGLDSAYDSLGLKDFEIEFLRQRATKRFSTPVASHASASRSQLELR